MIYLYNNNNDIFIITFYSIQLYKGIINIHLNSINIIINNSESILLSNNYNNNSINNN